MSRQMSRLAMLRGLGVTSQARLGAASHARLWSSGLTRHSALSASVLRSRQTFGFQACFLSTEKGKDKGGKKEAPIAEEEDSELFEEVEEPALPPPVVVEPEVTGEFEQKEFQAETRKLLDIVAGSLYSEKEVFIRELISNCSDAIEKARHNRLNKGEADDTPYEIHITTDDKNGIITFTDNGIGMTKKELVENLGTIARSGSLAFQEEQKQAGSQSEQLKAIIGKFGVGFYSSFIVGDTIKVYSRSRQDPEGKGHAWVCDMGGNYKVAEADKVAFGTKIIIKLRPENLPFSQKRKVSDIIKKYSSFVSTPILVNGERLNTVSPIWTKNKNEVTDEQHYEFYRYISNAFDDPQYHLHFATELPLQIKSVFYFPKMHYDLKFGQGRLEPGVNLHSRKVLVQSKAKDLLPEWLRFVKGVVDCEDVPLNISREFTQNRDLITKLNGVLTTRIVKFLNEQAKKDPETYEKWYKDFNIFLKEGVCSGASVKEDLGKLLRWPSSALEHGKVTSLDSYIDRMKPDQKAIYTMTAPNRDLALSSPYVAPLVKKGIEVLLLHEHIDDFVCVGLNEFKSKPIQSVDSPDVDQAIFKKEEKKGDDAAAKGAEDLPPMTPQEEKDLQAWLKETLGDKVHELRLSERDLSVPSIIISSESGAQRRIMKVMEAAGAGDPTLGNFYRNQKQTYEVNADHVVTKRLNVLRHTNNVLAADVAHQMFDNALVAAGLLDDPRPMLTRLNTLLEYAVGVHPPPALTAPPASDSANVVKDVSDFKSVEVQDMDLTKGK